jgi:hypothetical protein
VLTVEEKLDEMNAATFSALFVFEFRENFLK